MYMSIDNEYINKYRYISIKHTRYIDMYVCMMQDEICAIKSLVIQYIFKYKNNFLDI